MLEVCNQLVVLMLGVLATSNQFPTAINKDWFTLLMGEWDVVAHYRKMNTCFEDLFALLKILLSCLFFVLVVSTRTFTILLIFYSLSTHMSLLMTVE